MKRLRHKKSILYLQPQKNLAQVLLFISGLGTGYVYFDQTREPQVIQTAGPITVQPCFTPTYKCQPLILREIQNAQKSIYVMAYSFSAEPVAQALVEAFQKGIDVKVILDRSQLGNRSKRMMLEQAGIPVLIDSSVAIAHNKVMIFDGQRVITGSYNYSEVAENRNAENLIIIDNAEVASAFLKNWLSRQSAATTQKEMILNNDQTYPQE